jgi:hypothetical protein
MWLEQILRSIITPNCFQLNHMKNGNKDSSSSTSEAHLKSWKTIRGPYLDLEVSIFVKIFEFFHVAQFL